MRIVRTLFFMPFVVSQVVVGLVFGWFFHARFGLFNAMLDVVVEEGLADEAPEGFPWPEAPPETDVFVSPDIDPVTFPDTPAGASTPHQMLIS